MLHHRADCKSVAWVSLYFLLTLISWNAAQLHALAIITLAYFSFACACITHNTMHTPVFTDPRLESVWRSALSLTYGHPVSTFVPGHNISHHKFTQTAKDAMRTTKLRYTRNWLNLVMFQPTVALDVFRMDVRYGLLMRHLGDPYFQTCMREWALLLSSQVALLLLHPAKFFWLVYLPHLFAQTAIVSMNFLQHDGTDDSMASINSSRNFVGPVVNFLTFNNGLHTIHHLKPKLHWSRLPAAHAALVASQCHPALNQRCMARYMFRAFVYPGTRVDYQGQPVRLPDVEEDTDWTLLYAPEGVQREEYDVGLQGLLCGGALGALKVLCPVYSPVFKVD